MDNEVVELFGIYGKRVAIFRLKDEASHVCVEAVAHCPIVEP